MPHACHNCHRCVIVGLHDEKPGTPGMEGECSKKYEYDEILKHRIVNEHPMYHLTKKRLFLHIHQDSELKGERNCKKLQKL